MSEPSTAIPLGQLLDRRSRQSDRVRFTITEDWLQGRTAYGGVLSALAVVAMRDLHGAEWPLRALQTNFVGPVSAGPVDIQVTLLRQGKNVRQVKAQILQVDAQGTEQVAGVLLGVFGGSRSSQIAQRLPERPPVENAPEASLLMPFIPGLTPNFTQHLEFRLAEGSYPFQGGSTWHTRAHLRLKDISGLDAELQAIMLTDAGATPALGQANGFAPASSVSWALELRPIEKVSDGLWRLDQDTVAFDEGYANDRATLWTPDGQLAALGYQVVAVYA